MPLPLINVGEGFSIAVHCRQHKNLISVELVKRLGQKTTTHKQLHNIGWLQQGRDLCVNQHCQLPYNIKPFTDEVLCDISPLEVSDVLLGKP